MTISTSMMTSRSSVIGGLQGHEMIVHVFGCIVNRILSIRSRLLPRRASADRRARGRSSWRADRSSTCSTTPHSQIAVALVPVRRASQRARRFGSLSAVNSTGSSRMMTPRSYSGSANSPSGSISLNPSAEQSAFHWWTSPWTEASPVRVIAQATAFCAPKRLGNHARRARPIQFLPRRRDVIRERDRLVRSAGKVSVRCRPPQPSRQVTQNAVSNIDRQRKCGERGSQALQQECRALEITAQQRNARGAAIEPQYLVLAPSRIARRGINNLRTVGRPESVIARATYASVASPQVAPTTIPQSLSSERIRSGRSSSHSAAPAAIALLFTTSGTSITNRRSAHVQPATGRRLSGRTLRAVGRIRCASTRCGRRRGWPAR